jgi:hypothetical protein
LFPKRCVLFISSLAMEKNIFWQGLSLCCFILLLLNAATAEASHIRAGEITARRIDPLRPVYEITVTAYCDTGSDVVFGGGGLLNFGDGSSKEIKNDPGSPSIPRTRISDETWKYELTLIHTFPAQGTYKISYRELFRNAGVLNMNMSDAMPFYIETVVVIDAFIGVNNTPQLLVPPVDKGAVGKLYLHNPGAYDVDGDSLSYRLVFCKQAENTPVANYRFPNETFLTGDPRNGTNLEGEAPTFTLDPITGDLTWNTPGTKGEYNAAFLIEEWRKIDGEFYFLGYVTRDMQIIVEETENEPPVLQMPKDTCIVAGTILEAEILATDPDGDRVRIESYGGVYGLGATYNPADAAFQNLPASLQFRWETSCDDVQERPYTIHFKATDARGGDAGLVDLQSWNVTIVAPAPGISSVKVIDSRTLDLNFNIEDYLCKNEASEIQVWRRIGSNNFEPGTCETGMAEGKGYSLVDTRASLDFPFRDNSAGQGLTPGATYCYRIVAVFPQPKGGESIVSEEVCVTLPARVPLITNVSILETDEENGEVLLRWSPALEMDSTANPPPYTYDIYRSEGFAGGSYERIREATSDTSFIDRGVDTRNSVFNYYVMLRANGQEVDSSATASSVRLTPRPLIGSIELSWQAIVPWSNQVQEAPYHYVYRNKVKEEDAEAFVLIDSINVVVNGSFTYLDEGGYEALSDTATYCYFVITSDSYRNPLLPSPLLNQSQLICTRPNDTVRPCSPANLELVNALSCEEFIQQAECGINNFKSTLSWTAPGNDECQQDVAFWEIYFSGTSEENTFELVGTSVETTFVHDKLRSLAGYYFIVAVDHSGNRSDPSELVQTDNCPNYWLPNVFTPNGDGINETFGPPTDGANPSHCPRFVQAVEFTVYNRWGKEVFSYNTRGEGDEETSVYLQWDGRANNGEILSPGVYYYVAAVTFDVLSPEKRAKTLKGWIQLVTED